MRSHRDDHKPNHIFDNGYVQQVPITLKNAEVVEGFPNI